MMRFEIPMIDVYALPMLGRLDAHVFQFSCDVRDITPRCFWTEEGYLLRATLSDGTFCEVAFDTDRPASGLFELWNACVPLINALGRRQRLWGTI